MELADSILKAVAAIIVLYLGFSIYWHLRKFLFTAMAWIYLYIKFRDISKVKEHVKDKYLGNFAVAGMDSLLKIVAITGALFLTIILILMIIKIIYDLIIK